MGSRAAALEGSTKPNVCISCSELRANYTTEKSADSVLDPRSPSPSPPPSLSLSLSLPSTHAHLLEFCAASETSVGAWGMVPHVPSLEGRRNGKRTTERRRRQRRQQEQ